MQRKSVLQPAILASCSYPVLAHKSFQLAPKPFLISRIDYNPSVIWIFPKNSTCLSGKLRTKITSSIAKSTSPGLSDTTFLAGWHHTKYQLCFSKTKENFSITLSKMWSQKKIRLRFTFSFICNIHLRNLWKKSDFCNPNLVTFCLFIYLIKSFDLVILKWTDTC